jgi:hypothetical protein
MIENPAPVTVTAGMLRFVRYGFMPNRLRYRDGNDNRSASSQWDDVQRLPAPRARGSPSVLQL